MSKFKMNWSNVNRKKAYVIVIALAIIQVIIIVYQIATEWLTSANVDIALLIFRFVLWSGFAIIFWIKYKKLIATKTN